MKFQFKPYHGGILFMGVGIICFSISMYLTIDNILFLRKALLTKGTVIEMVELLGTSQPGQSITRQGKTTYYHPKVEFISFTGNKVIILSSHGTNPPSHFVSEEVDLFYNPSNPKEAKLTAPEDLWLGPITLSILAFIAFPIGYGIKKYMK